jgi:hypothetical protein
MIQINYLNNPVHPVNSLQKRCAADLTGVNPF